MADKKESTPATGRTITVGKITYPIVKTYYNSLQDAVIDVYEKTRIVETRKGDKEVALQVHIRSKDEALQKKHSRNRNENVEVNVDVE